MAPKELTKELVTEIAWAADLDVEEQLRFDYPGRGYVYSGKSFGITGDLSLLLKFVTAAAQLAEAANTAIENVDDVPSYDAVVEFLIRAVQSDNMG